MDVDLFCLVNDNFGDVGVCWRLARQLANEHRLKVRLWISDLDRFSYLEKDISKYSIQQCLNGMQIIKWMPDCLQSFDFIPAKIVIEAFGCNPPDSFIQAMNMKAYKPPIWINLEYLSAENWVESCHGLPSKRTDGLKKYFFFPGFTSATGGLLREAGLLEERDAFQASLSAQEKFLQRIGLSKNLLEARRQGARLVSLFCYKHAPITALLQTLACNERPSILLVPKGIDAFLGTTKLVSSPLLTVINISFMSSSDYDRLLWCADLNFVRGEDSFVRAIWAGQAFVWHIYAQEHNHHLKKLQAWLERYDVPTFVHQAMLAWNDERTTNQITALQESLLPSNWTQWQQAAQIWANKKASHTDLAKNLIAFCANIIDKR